MFQKKRKYSIKSSLVIFIFAVVSTLFVLYQMEEYNDSVLDIYAQKQDDYVKLVLEQINLYPDKTEDEIISQILGTLKTSASEYWTLTKNEQFLYVKNDAETKRYKDFVVETYYASDSGKAFIDSLTINRVVHMLIDIKGERYVASGTEFLYQGAVYKICLLTYDKFILENNSFLQARIMILLVIFVFILLLFLIAMIFVEVVNRNAEKRKQMEEHIKKQNLTIEELQDKLAMEYAYSASDNIFHEKVLHRFLDKLEVRGIAPLTLMMIRLSEGVKKETVIRQFDWKIQKKYLKFELGEDSLLFIYLKVRPEEIEEKLKGWNEKGAVLFGSCCIEKKDCTYQIQYEKFKRRWE